MNEKPWGCLKQTAAGCGILIVLAIVVPIVIGLMMTRPFNRAVEARATMEERFGPQDGFVPPLDGVPAADRIETFIEVRRTLKATCVDFSAAEEGVARLEAFDDQDEVNKMDVMKQAFSTTKNMMGIGPVLGRFYETRNQSLLDADMGLGEFTYIFTLAYRDQMLDPTSDFSLFGPGATNRRVRLAMVSMLQNQRGALVEAGGSDDDLAALDAEIAAMESDSDRILWQDEMPPLIAAALAPYREELDELYCPPAAPLELMINVKHGPSVEGI